MRKVCYLNLLYGSISSYKPGQTDGQTDGRGAMRSARSRIKTCELKSKTVFNRSVVADSDEMNGSIAAGGIHVVTRWKATEQLLFPTATDDPGRSRSLGSEASNSSLKLFDRPAAPEVDGMQMTTEVSQVDV